MQINIHFSGGKKSDFGNHDFENVLAGSLERFESRLKIANMYISDANGPKGGVDKYCRCVLHLRRMSPIVIQDQDASMSALLYRVANRASYALAQKVNRKNKRKREKVTELLMEPVLD